MYNAIINMIKNVYQITFTILLLSMNSCRSLEDCYKDYIIEGTVINNVGAPYAGVEVIFTRGTDKSQGLTDNNGRYSFSFQTRGNLTGFQVGFKLNGNEVAVSDPLTENEVGYPQCGMHSTITKNVIIP